jgi:MoaA/NifB/PqqE/SkfB family radical SAM enzyme
MMALDALDNLDQWPLKGILEFIEECKVKGVRDVYLTSTNTDAILYRHADKLRRVLPLSMRLGFRTNGVAIRRFEQLIPFDMGSVTLCSTDPDIYRKMMGQGDPPDLRNIVDLANMALVTDVKVNIVLGPENIGDDLVKTIRYCADLGIKRINVREPYGQPHIGDPLAGSPLQRKDDVHGSPTYMLNETEVTYCDVHFVEVESVNLYANGRISKDYPITRGHDENGRVYDQSNFTHGRHVQQWQKRSLPVVIA